MLTENSNTKLRWLSICAVLLIATLLAACAAPAAVPTATPIPPTAVPPTDTPIPPTATPVPPTATPVPAAADTSDVISGFADNDGVQIYYEVVGEGPPLLLLHGMGGTLLDWYEFGYVDALKDDYQLILMDWRGHHKSDKPLEPEAYSNQLLISDVVAVLDELGIDKVHAFATVPEDEGYALVKYAPERVSSLILSHVTARETRRKNYDTIYG